MKNKHNSTGRIDWRGKRVTSALETTGRIDEGKVARANATLRPRPIEKQSLKLIAEPKPYKETPKEKWNKGIDDS